MQPRYSWQIFVFVVVAIAGACHAEAGFLTFSHSSSALPGAPGPAITVLSITADNDGTNLKFTLTFVNPTVEGPSSGNDDAVYGFINIDADKNSATGLTGAFLDANNVEAGFGNFPPGSDGIDAFINLTSEGDPLHGAPGLVDLVGPNLLPIDTLAVTYTNQSGATPSMLSLSIPLSVFSNNQISLLDTGNFSVVVGNANATDFLPGEASSVPEPQSALLLVAGLLTLGARRIGALRCVQRKFRCAVTGS